MSQNNYERQSNAPEPIPRSSPDALLATKFLLPASSHEIIACPHLLALSIAVHPLNSSYASHGQHSPTGTISCFDATAGTGTDQDFTQLYAKRAGIEGTISQEIRMMGLRRSRYIGQERTHLQHVATAAALNLVRSMAWVHGVPRAQTRLSAFARLYHVAHTQVRQWYRTCV